MKYKVTQDLEGIKKNTILNQVGYVLGEKEVNFGSFYTVINGEVWGVNQDYIKNNPEFFEEIK